MLKFLVDVGGRGCSPQKAAPLLFFANQAASKETFLKIQKWRCDLYETWSDVYDAVSKHGRL